MPRPSMLSNDAVQRITEAVVKIRADRMAEIVAAARQFDCASEVLAICFGTHYDQVDLG